MEFRIAIMCWGGPNYMGVWNYYLNMAKVLNESTSHLRLVFFCPADLSPERRKEAEDVTGEKIFYLPQRAKWRDVLALLGWWDREFYRKCMEANIQLVFEQAKFLGAAFPLPVLAWIGDLQHCYLPQYFSPLHRITRDVGYRSQVYLRNNVLVSSRSAKQDIARFFGRAGGNIHVVPFAVQSPLQVNSAHIAEVVAKYDLPENYLFLPNQFWRHKNHETAFRALRELRNRGKAPIIALSGQTKDFRFQGHAEDLLGFAKDLDIQANLRWLGPIPYDDLLHLTAGASALINPSLFEGWSTTVEEAKCLGAPMVLSALDVHREQAEGRADFFKPLDPAEMANAIESAISKSNQVDVMSRLRRAQCAYRTDISRYGERLTAAIEQAIDDHAKGRSSFA